MAVYNVATGDVLESVQCSPWRRPPRHVTTIIFIEPTKRVEWTPQNPLFNPCARQFSANLMAVERLESTAVDGGFAGSQKAIMANQLGRSAASLLSSIDRLATTWNLKRDKDRGKSHDLSIPAGGGWPPNTMEGSHVKALSCDAAMRLPYLVVVRPSIDNENSRDTGKCAAPCVE